MSITTLSTWHLLSCSLLLSSCFGLERYNRRDRAAEHDNNFVRRDTRWGPDAAEAGHQRFSRDEEEGELEELLEEAIKRRRGMTKRSDKTEEDAKEWLKQYNKESVEFQRQIALASYNYNTNLTKENGAKLKNLSVQIAKWSIGKESEANKFDQSSMKDYDVKRMLKMVTTSAALHDEKDISRLADIGNKLEEMWGSSKACRKGSNGKEECLGIEPGLLTIMAKSRSWDELLWAWNSWRDVTGRPMKPLFMEMVQLQNKGAKNNSFSDIGEFWREAGYENKAIDKEVDDLWEVVKPLYQQLHAYVRRKLINVYGADKVKSDEPIPAHLLGNMWGQQWNNIVDLTLPYPEENTDSSNKKNSKSNILVKKNYTVKKLFQTAEAFYKSIGLFEMTDEFWKYSMLEKPKDGREVVCHGSASDMFAKDDFRIKMCSEVNMEYLYTAFHEMGHIEYFMAYSHQPSLYRSGANEAFHEAIGDTMALSGTSSTHLNVLGLVDENKSTESDINSLFRKALEKVAFLPFGLLMDKWRWAYFRGEFTAEEMNREWWNLRLKYQGFQSPVPRTSHDFDPAAKYHIISSVPYLRYFYSFLIQFQFHEALCKLAGHTGPLHTCDIYQSKRAGETFKKMLSMGGSKPWPEAMKVLTGQSKMKADSFLRYFKPLHEWLVKQNAEEKIGWTSKINWESD